ncbi:MAG: [Fe-Fe] hydrogenase large subunit C-terminal domain-containing protein [Eubacteriales bacterium]|nr:[Fe-Fe] hydrogenase large subunit C-terminal domain-containing protein [Eubacteriales bacterium]MDD4390381.1 [Fe-Fe] hydrogenase large subunit C-terminal domain-containing protein [Eubacteriales bacterium]
MKEFLKLNKAYCKNCYKCIRHCPVKSMRFSGDQAHILSDECVLCGQCYVSCPQNAREIVDTTEIVKTILYDDAPVIASVAPAFPSFFEGVGFESLRKGLIALGFKDAEETAVAATNVKKEYERMIAEKEQSVIITSCCHSVNLLVRKYFPQIAYMLAPVYSPMIAHSIILKERYPDAKTVFISPCVSKKEEAEESAVDAVITFDELAKMFEAANIELEPSSDYPPDYKEESKTRLFPTVGGIIRSMNMPNKDYLKITIDGIDNCVATLEDIANGTMKNCFIEMSACLGSCIRGPLVRKKQKSFIHHFHEVISSAGKKDFNVPSVPSEVLRREQEYIPIDVMPTPSEAEIIEILRKTGKIKPEDELNCESCGYNTCREKAIAIYQGKANGDMCLPYLMGKGERFTSNILQQTSNGILVVNENMEVQEINYAAMRMLRVTSKADVLGGQLVRILDPLPFLSVLRNGSPFENQRTYYADIQKYLSLSIVHDKASSILTAVIRDVTSEEEERVKRQDINRRTVETADKVVDKQMRIVQEIASLLGETAAETKIALTKLKESIEYEKD